MTRNSSLLVETMRHDRHSALQPHPDAGFLPEDHLLCVVDTWCQPLARSGGSSRRRMALLLCGLRLLSVLLLAKQKTQWPWRPSVVRVTMSVTKELKD